MQNKWEQFSTLVEGEFCTSIGTEKTSQHGILVTQHADVPTFHLFFFAPFAARVAGLIGAAVVGAVLFLVLVADPPAAGAFPCSDPLATGAFEFAGALEPDPLASPDPLATAAFGLEVAAALVPDPLAWPDSPAPAAFLDLVLEPLTTPVCAPPDASPSSWGSTSS